METSLKGLAPALSRASAKVAPAFSSRLISRLAASTSRRSATSSTSIFPTCPKPMCIASDEPRERAPMALRSPCATGRSEPTSWTSSGSSVVISNEWTTTPFHRPSRFPRSPISRVGESPALRGLRDRRATNRDEGPGGAGAAAGAAAAHAVVHAEGDVASLVFA